MDKCVGGCDADRDELRPVTNSEDKFFGGVEAARLELTVRRVPAHKRTETERCGGCAGRSEPGRALHQTAGVIKNN